MIDYLEGTISERTKTLYQDSWNRYTAFCQELDLNSSLSASVLAWRKRLVDSNYSPNTINQHLSAIKSLFKGAMTAGAITIETYMMIKAIGSVSTLALKERLKPKKDILTLEDVERIVAAIDTKTLAGLRDKAMIVLLATTGLRIQELVDASTGAWDIDQGLLYVMGKTDVQPRPVPVTELAKQSIMNWLFGRGIYSEWIFTSFAGRSMQPLTKAMTTQAAYDLITTRASAVGIDIAPHDFRRFVATTLASRNIVEAKKMLGHKSINTTQVYIRDSALPVIDWLDK